MWEMRSQFFFFSSRRRHTRYIGDWSSDVCSSDLGIAIHAARVIEGVHRFDQIESGAGRDHKRMISDLAKERGDTIGQEIIYHRNGAAHYKPQGQFDEERTRDLLGL